MQRGLIAGLALLWAGCSFTAAASSSSGDDGGTQDSPDASTADAGQDSAVASCLPLPAGAVAWWDGEKLGKDIVGSFDYTDTFSVPRVSPGFIDNAMTLGEDDDIIFDTPPAPAEFTLEGWIYRIEDHDNDWVTIYGNSNDSGLFLYDNKLNYWDDSVGSDTDGNAVVGGTVVPIDSWHHVAVTWDGSDLTLYLDGVSDGTVSESDINLPVDQGRIGGVDFSDGKDFIGQIDELTVYSRALDAGEIADIAAAAELGKCKPGS